jgi:hypothetical protein
VVEDSAASLDSASLSSDKGRRPVEIEINHVRGCQSRKVSGRVLKYGSHGHEESVCLPSTGRYSAKYKLKSCVVVKFNGGGLGGPDSVEAPRLDCLERGETTSAAAFWRFPPSLDTE